MDAERAKVLPPVQPIRQQRGGSQQGHLGGGVEAQAEDHADRVELPFLGDVGRRTRTPLGKRQTVGQYTGQGFSQARPTGASATVDTSTNPAP